MRAIVIHAAHDLRVEPFADVFATPAPGFVRVRMAAGGICGSDLHYFHHGGFGVVRVKQPMALGHEASGRIEALGAGVAGLEVGALVAVNPSQPCLACANCRAGLRVHCTDMRFSGSAMRFPHEQGLFRECVDVPAERALAMPAGVAPEEAALCEPLAVVLHAAGHAGDLAGKTVFVAGCGPIGVIAIAVAKLKGAARVIATDVAPHALEMARRLGADEAINVASEPERLQPYAEGKGSLDAAFECSGNPAGLASAISVLRPQGRLVLIGLGGDGVAPMNAIVTKELVISGSFRFDREFDEAARLIGGGLIDLKAMITAVYPLEQAEAAFLHASDKSRATKVAVRLGPE